MIHKSPTPRRQLSRPNSSSVPQTPSIRSASTFSSLKRKNSVTPLATPRSVSSSRNSSGQTSPIRGSSPTRSTASTSSSISTSTIFNHARLNDGFVHPSQILRPKSSPQLYTGSISVAIRVKPSETSSRNPWFLSDERTIIHNELGEFSFDHVFHPTNDNFAVYEETARPMIEKLFQGFNSTIFAYGMTGSGKTFTMSGTSNEPGLIPLSVNDIFSNIMSKSLDNQRFDVKVSYLEIYNEKIYDLLNYQVSKGSFGTKTTGIELKIRDDSKYGVKVIGLTEQEVDTSEDVMKWIALGNSNRKTGETDFNSRSSRSHAIVLIRLTCTDLNSGLETTSTLSLCDLAGSERATAQRERRKEGAFINKSLLALGTVISKLSAESTQNTGVGGGHHIPYRDSKLTRILQPALSGDGIVTTICTVDAHAESSAETINTIRFASRAKNISMVVKRNEMDISNEKDHIIENLRRQLEQQKETIAVLKSNNGTCRTTDAGGIAGAGGASEDALLLQSENKVLKLRLEHCEKLLDKDSMILQDQELVEIVDMLPPDVSTVLESKIQGIESQLREHKAYAAHLEHQLQNLQHQVTGQSISSRFAAEVDVDAMLHEQEAELMELRKSLERKDKMIEALQNAKRVRENILKPVGRSRLNQQNQQISLLEDVKQAAHSD